MFSKTYSQLSTESGSVAFLNCRTSARSHVLLPQLQTSWAGGGQVTVISQEYFIFVSRDWVSTQLPVVLHITHWLLPQNSPTLHPPDVSVAISACCYAQFHHEKSAVGFLRVSKLPHISWVKGVSAVVLLFSCFTSFIRNTHSFVGPS